MVHLGCARAVGVECGHSRAGNADAATRRSALRGRGDAVALRATRGSGPRDRLEHRRGASRRSDRLPLHDGGRPCRNGGSIRRGGGPHGQSGGPCRNLGSCVLDGSPAPCRNRPGVVPDRRPGRLRAVERLSRFRVRSTLHGAVGGTLVAGRRAVRPQARLATGCTHVLDRMPPDGPDPPGRGSSRLAPRRHAAHSARMGELADHRHAGGGDGNPRGGVPRLALVLLRPPASESLLQEGIG
jgi:hypothetical protein